MLEPERGRVTLGDKKSHLLSYMVGFCTGAFVCSIVVLATAMTQNGGI